MKTIFAFFVATTLFFAGCSELITELPENQEADIQNKAYIQFNLENDTSRTILPSNIDKEEYSYEFYIQKEGEESVLYGTYTGYTALKQAFSSKIEIIPGKYTFTLKAKTELGTALIAETQKQVTTGNNTVSFTFEKVTTGTGTLEVAFEIPLNGAEKVTAQLCTLNGTAVTGFEEEVLELVNAERTSKVTYKKQNVPYGNYVVKFYAYLNASDTEWLDVKTETVKVAAANQTIGQLELEEVNEYYTIEYELNGGEWADGFVPVTKLNKKQPGLPTSGNVKDYMGIPFYGWYDNESLTGDPVTVVEGGTTDNKKYFAKYAIVTSVYELEGKLAKLTGDRCTVVITDLDPEFWYIESILSRCDINNINIDLNLDKCAKLISIGRETFKGCRSLTSVTIPDSVTSIKRDAFYGCSSLTSVTIPDGVTSINNSAFRGCSSLTSVSIPDGVTSIGNYAFYNCSSLTSVTIPDGVTSIGDYAFYNCSSLTSVTIPDGVTSIGNYAFYNCSSLTSITIPDGVTSIGDYAFYNCRRLTSVTIPDSVTTIKNGAFNGCENLRNIYIKDIKAWLKISDLGELMSCSSDKNLYLNNQLVTDLIIPDGVTSINNSAFYGCSSLTSVTIPDGVTSIGNYAFRGCSSLTSVTIPDGVTSIGNYAFYNCSSLTSVTIPDSVTSIGNYAFRGCSSLTSVTIPDGVTSIGNYAFYNCSNLTSVTIPDGVTSIGYSAFSGCSNLTSVTIPDGVTSIGFLAFSGCENLRNIYIKDIKAWLKISGLGDLMSYSSDKNLYLNNQLVTDLIIPDGVTSIGRAAFYGCSNLTSVTIPDSVTSINDTAFYNVPHIYYNGSATGRPWGAKAIN